MKHFLLYTLLLISSFSKAQYNKGENLVNVIPYWNKGAVYEYEVTETEYDFKRYDTINRKTTSYDLKLTIIDSTENSYTVEWKTKINMPTENPEIIKIIEEHFKDLGDYKILYKTNELGAIQEITNQDEVKKYYTRLMNIATKDLNLSENEKKLFFQFIDNDEYFDTFLLQDLNQFHQFYSYQFTTTPIINEIEYTNPFTNTPIQLKQTYKLNQYDEEDETYSLRMDQYVDEEKFLNDIKKIITKKKDDTLKDMNVWVSLEQVLHNSGILLYSKNTKVVDVDGTSKSVIKEFILK